MTKATSELPPYCEEHVWESRLRGDKVSAKHLQFLDATLERAAGVKCWVWLLSHSLNCLYSRSSSLYSAGGPANSVGPPSVAQLACIENLDRLAIAFCENTATLPVFSWSDFIPVF